VAKLASSGRRSARPLPGIGGGGGNLTGNSGMARGEGFMVASARVVAERPQTGAIDEDHLARMTLGELSLQRQVLALFDRQADLLLPRIRAGEPGVAAASAHVLKGSAAGIGAFKVARAADAVEQAPSSNDPNAAMTEAVDMLAVLLDEAKAEIARLLRAG
jgi:HPt (histidine-containing phosphotransfer) domain-containing protein